MAGRIMSHTIMQAPISSPIWIRAIGRTSAYIPSNLVTWSGLVATLRCLSQEGDTTEVVLLSTTNYHTALHKLSDGG